MRLDDVNLRVDGVVQGYVECRRAMEDGYPGGGTEIIVWDPVLGTLTLTDSFYIEVKLGDSAWKRVTLKELQKIISK